MFEPTANVGKSNFRISALEGEKEFAFGIGTDTAEFGFDFGNTFFFGIEVGGVSR